MNAVVFLGPTLPRAEAADLLSATYLPPARQGDIYRAVRALRPLAVGLVDGRFLDTGAVWHREILWALSEGVHVFGAASMGALRAAELAPFGMRGIGQVFAAYRDGCWPGDPGAFEDDDEVAVVYAPPELGGGALSDAMVDLRATLVSAEAAGVAAASDRRLLIEALKRRPFAERSVAALLDDAARLLDVAAVRRLAAWLPGNKVERKRLDAVEMLRAMAALLAAAPSRFTADFVMQQPLFWRRFVAQCDTEDAEALDPAARGVLERLRGDLKAWHTCARAALGRLPPACGGTIAEAEAPPHRALARLRRDRGLWRRSDLLAWMASNGLDEAGLERLVLREDELDRAAAEASAGLLRAMADHLRLSGAFAAILRDAGGAPP
jgi:hypothetical protein